MLLILVLEGRFVRRLLVLVYYLVGIYYLVMGWGVGKGWYFVIKFGFLRDEATWELGEVDSRERVKGDLFYFGRKGVWWRVLGEILFCR